MLTEEQRKNLLAKRKYYSEHPEEARKEYVKKFDGIGAIVIDPKMAQEKKNDNKDDK